MRTMRAWLRASFAVCALAAAPLAKAAPHPLDGLSAEEIKQAVALLTKAGLLNKTTTLNLLQLDEPAKEAVIAWQPGDPMPRRAVAVIRRGGKTLQVGIDLTQSRFGKAKEIYGQPLVTPPEMAEAIKAVLKDQRMRAALGQRHVDFGKLFCGPRTVGNFGRAEENEKRLLRVDCYDLRPHPTNAFATPVEGLYATYDVDAKAVLDVIDTGVVPIPPGSYPLARKAAAARLPANANIEIDGGVVRWRSWRFHLRFDPRAGVVISQAGYNDHGRTRSVLYQGYVSEVFVPYQDPSITWAYRAYLDEGDYGLGTSASRLAPGSDCPRDAHFISPPIALTDGRVSVLPDRVCVFERAQNEPTWRHFDTVSGAHDFRPDTDLVVRFVATLANYDYLFDWVLDAKGGITFRGGASGLDAVKGVKAQKFGDPSFAGDTEFGPLIAPGRAAIWHDHFFSLRLDVDVDGRSNRFLMDRLKVVPVSGAARKSVWRVETEPVTSEPAQLHMSTEHPAQWRIASTRGINALGYATSYVLHGDMGAMPLVDPTDVPLSRAAFARHHLWITQYDPREKWAAGEFPNQSTPGQGLPQWSARKRKLDGEDIVLWYTLGFHHLPSAEDWPVYNVGWHSVRLAPFNFFDQNPAIDKPQAETRNTPATRGR